MSPPNLNFWSISHKESLESQQEHALRNRFLRTLLCLNDIFNPGYSRKKLMRKRTSILDGVVLIMDSCFIQYNAQLIKYVNVAQKINLFCQEQRVFCQLQVNFIFFEVQFISVTVHETNELVCISLEVYTYFSYAIKYCPL